MTDFKLILIHRQMVRESQSFVPHRSRLTEYSFSKQAAAAFSQAHTEVRSLRRTIRELFSSSFLAFNKMYLTMIREPYEANMQCDWRISVNAGSTVLLFISDMQMEDQGACTFDYLEVS